MTNLELSSSLANLGLSGTITSPVATVPEQGATAPATEPATGVVAADTVVITPAPDVSLLSPATGGKTTGDIATSSVVPATDMGTGSSRAATPVPTGGEVVAESEGPILRPAVSTHSAAEEDAGEAAGDDANSAAERYWIPCPVTEEQLQSMADEGLLPPKDNGGWRSAFGDTEIGRASCRERV